MNLVVSLFEQLLRLLLVQLLNNYHILNRVSDVPILLVPQKIVVDLWSAGAGKHFGEMHLELLQAVASLIEVNCVNKGVCLLLRHNGAACILRLNCRHILSLHFLINLLIIITSID